MSDAAELIVANDAIAPVGEPGVGIADIIARHAGAAVETKQDFIAGAEAVGVQIVAIDFDVADLIGPAFIDHLSAPAAERHLSLRPGDKFISSYKPAIERQNLQHRVMFLVGEAAGAIL